MKQFPGSKGRIMHWLHGEDGPRWGSSPGDFDPDAVRRIIERLKPVFGPGGYLPTEVSGWEHIPAGPVMFVANHSGGTLIPDVWGLLFAWYTRMGVGRPLHPLGHDLIFSLSSAGRFFARHGVVRAGHDRAYEVLRTWKRDLLVYPGGDQETWRPYSQRYEVKFDGRKGYARLALKAGVPIVPVAHAGAHQTLVVLTDGRKLARALHFQQIFRAEIFPVHLSLPWGLTIGPWPHIPVPAHLRYRIGRPIMLPGRAPVSAPSQRDVDELDLQVRFALQTELTRLKEASRDALRRPLESLEDVSAPVSDVEVEEPIERSRLPWTDGLSAGL